MEAALIVALSVEFVKWVIENHPAVYTEFLDVRMRSGEELRREVDEKRKS